MKSLACWEPRTAENAGKTCGRDACAHAPKRGRGDLFSDVPTRVWEIDFQKAEKRFMILCAVQTPRRAYMMYRDEKIKVYRVTAQKYSGTEPCGTILYADSKQGLGIRCADGMVAVEELKRCGARCMDARIACAADRLRLGIGFKTGRIAKFECKAGGT